MTTEQISQMQTQITELQALIANMQILGNSGNIEATRNQGKRIGKHGGHTMKGIELRQILTKHKK